MKIYPKIFTLLFIVCAVFFFAQTSAIKVVSETTIATTNEELLTVMVKIENTGGTFHQFELVSGGDKGIRILNGSIPVKLQPQEKIFVPVKIYIEKTQPAGSSELTFSLKDSDQKTVARTVTELTIASKRSLRIIANNPQVIIERLGDSLRVSTLIYNGGNQTEAVEIAATFPQGYNSDQTQRKKTLIEPFSNREVVFSKIIDKELLQLEVFAVNISAKNTNSEYFGNVMVMVQNALGNRRYIDPLNLNQYLQRSSPNRVAYSTSNPFSEFSATHNLDLQTEVNIGNTKAGINMNGTYWPQRGGEIMVQNAWLKLENGPFGLQLGNINGTDLEVSLMGRGAQFSYSPVSTKKLSFTAGAVEKSYNLFDPFTNRSRGFTAFAKSVYGLNEEKTVSSEVIMDTDLFQKGFIFKNGYEFHNNTDTFYSFDLGYGYARAEADEEVAKSSLFLGFNYRKNWKKYVFTSSNYYGSGYYPGLKKGSTVFEQRLSRNFEKLAVYAGYSLNIFEPRNIDPLYPYNTSSKRSRIETGTNFSIAEGLSINLSSQIFVENSDIFLANSYGPTTVDFRSAVLKSNLNYNTPDNRDRISLVYSQGASYYRGLTKPRAIRQVQANWYRGNFMLSANYQDGTFMLYEGNVNGTLNSDTEKISAIANYRLPLLNKKLNMNFSTFLNYERLNGNSLSFSSTFDYKIRRATKLFGTINYNQYSRNDFSTANTYYQLGISQDLPTIGEETVKYKNGVIKVFTFYDLNNDTIYDPAVDQPAPEVKIKINNTLFISGSDGNITYRKVPYGDYALKSLESKWYSDDRKIELAQKEIFVTIPLGKTSVVQGTVVYQQTSKTQYDVQEILAGIPIIFNNDFGKSFTFYTNSEGKYTAYLPVGIYQISLDTSVLQKNVYIENNLKSVTAEEEKVIEIERFLLKVREKKVEVTRFGTSD